MGTGGKHYIPKPDGVMDGWGENLRAYLEVNYPLVGLSEDDYLAIKAAYQEWHERYSAHVSARAAADAAKEDKDDARAAFEAAVRPRVRVVQAFAGTTDSARASMGVTVPGERSGRTSAESALSAPPRASLVDGPRLTHTLRIAGTASLTARGKPRGVHGAEVWMRVGGAGPVLEGELRFAGVATTSTHRLSFGSADGGKLAHYWVRWVDFTGNTGPWGGAVQATIGA